MSCCVLRVYTYCMHRQSDGCPASFFALQLLSRVARGLRGHERIVTRYFLYGLRFIALRNLVNPINYVSVSHRERETNVSHEITREGNNNEFCRIWSGEYLREHMLLLHKYNSGKRDSFETRSRRL